MLRFFAILLFCLLTVSAYGGVEEGEKAYKRQDYTTAFKEFKKGWLTPLPLLAGDHVP